MRTTPRMMRTRTARKPKPRRSRQMIPPSICRRSTTSLSKPLTLSILLNPPRLSWRKSPSILPRTMKMSLAMIATMLSAMTVMKNSMVMTPPVITVKPRKVPTRNLPRKMRLNPPRHTPCPWIRLSRRSWNRRFPWLPLTVVKEMTTPPRKRTTWRRLTRTTSYWKATRRWFVAPK